MINVTSTELEDKLNHINLSEKVKFYNNIVNSEPITVSETWVKNNIFNQKDNIYEKQ